MGPIGVVLAADALKIAIGSKVFQVARVRCRPNASRAALALVEYRFGSCRVSLWLLSSIALALVACRFGVSIGVSIA